MQNEAQYNNPNGLIPPRYVPTVTSGERNRVIMDQHEFKVTLNNDLSITKESLGKIFSDGVLAFRGSEAAAIQEVKRLLMTISNSAPYTYGAENRLFAFYLSREAAQELLAHYQRNKDTTSALSKDALETIEKIANSSSEDSNRPKYATQWPKQIDLPNGTTLDGDLLRRELLALTQPVFEISEELAATQTRIHEMRHVGQLQMNNSLGAFLDDIYPEELAKLKSTPDTLPGLTEKYSSSEMNTIFLIKGAAFRVNVLLEADSILHEMFGELSIIESADHFSPEVFSYRVVDLVSRFLSLSLPNFSQKNIEHDITQLTTYNSPYTLYSPHSTAMLVLLFGDSEFDTETILSARITETPHDQLLGMVIAKIFEIQADPEEWLSSIKNADLEERISQAILTHQKKVLGLMKQKIEEDDDFLMKYMTDPKTTKEKIDVYLNVS